MNRLLTCLLALSLYAVPGYAQEAGGAGAPISAKWRGGLPQKT